MGVSPAHPCLSVNLAKNPAEARDEVREDQLKLILPSHHLACFLTFALAARFSILTVGTSPLRSLIKSNLFCGRRLEWGMAPAADPIAAPNGRPFPPWGVGSMDAAAPVLLLPIRAVNWNIWNNPHI